MSIFFKRKYIKSINNISLLKDCKLILTYKDNGLDLSYISNIYILFPKNINGFNAKYMIIQNNNTLFKNIDKLFPGSNFDYCHWDILISNEWNNIEHNIQLSLIEMLFNDLLLFFRNL